MATYRVQRDDDVQTMDEAKLRKKLRKKDLTGLELVRRDDDETWVPLCETELFRDEVPFRGHPRNAARQREVQGFVGHLTGWGITAVVMAALGSWFPFWLWIWGIFVVVHGAKVAPSALGLLGDGELFGSTSGARLPEGASARRPAIQPATPGRPRLTDKVAQVRALLRERGGDGDARLARQVEQLGATLQEIAQRRADLEAQLSPDKLRELQAARQQTRLRLEGAASDQERSFLKDELVAIDQRHEAVETAQRTVDRLQSRERTAEHQLEQLRLDLAQAQARAVDVPDFAERVEAIRIEAAALEEVEEVLAESRRRTE